MLKLLGDRDLRLKARLGIDVQLVALAGGEVAAAGVVTESDLRAALDLWLRDGTMEAPYGFEPGDWVALARVILRSLGTRELVGLLADRAIQADADGAILAGLWQGVSSALHLDVFADAVMDLEPVTRNAILGRIGPPPDGDAATYFAEDGWRLVRIGPPPATGLGLRQAAAQALAHRVLSRPSDTESEAWARTWLPEGPTRAATLSPVPSKLILQQIASCRDAEMGGLLEVYREAPTPGLCAALASRRSPPSPSTELAAALLCAPDPEAEVDAGFVRWCSEDRAFLTALEARVAREGARWRLNDLGLAWRHLYEDSCFRWGRRIEESGTTLAGRLRASLQLKSVVLREQVWQAAERLLQLWAARAPERARRHLNAELVEVGVAGLEAGVGAAAAELILRIRRQDSGAALLEGVRGKAEALLPGLPADVQELLYPWIQMRFTRARGASPEPAAPRPPAVLPASGDLARLAVECWSTEPEVVAAAVEALLKRGAKGEDVLATAIAAASFPSRVEQLVATLPRWNRSGKPFRRLRAALEAGAVAALPGSRAAFALVVAGDRVLFPALRRYLEREDGPEWFQAPHWKELTDAGYDPAWLERELCLSAHAGAYFRAIMAQMTLPALVSECERVDLVRAFLERGPGRSAELRRRAAEWLWPCDPGTALPVLLQAAESDDWKLAGAPAGLAEGALSAAIRSIQLHAAGQESGLLAAESLDPARMMKEGFERCVRQWFDETDSPQVRARLLRAVGDALLDWERCERLASVFAWGVTLSRALTGHTYKISVVRDEGELGYTRLAGREIWVNPLPLLRGERGGEAVVRGLILHELGHHVYHSGKKNAAVWEEAGMEKLHGLLNLVSDEHLERNLRSVSPAYGDDLKVLNAYAFLHQRKPLEPAQLVETLDTDAGEILSQVPLRVARHPGSVLVGSGWLLKVISSRRSAYARFIVALRAGTANHGRDDTVARALALFRGGFRRKSLGALLEIARRLRDLFGPEGKNARDFEQNLANPNRGEADGNEVDRLTGGMRDETLQEAIARVLARRRRGSKGGEEGRAIALGMNVDPESTFARIDHVVRLVPDAVRFAAVAREHGAEVRRLRRFFEQLGRQRRVVGPRTQGRRVMAGRLRRLVGYRDPRVLATSDTVEATDLFVGVVIDCSGSMWHMDHIDLARRFGVLVAAAVRGNRGVDARFWGFTDETIFDCGAPEACAVTRLEAGGGNNDAAALWHAAREAAKSRRRSRLLVMISDGLPTECTVTALRSLVARLQRGHYCCAQVAVRPISEVCFPHYIEITESDFAAATRNFGRVITRLVNHAINS